MALGTWVAGRYTGSHTPAGGGAASIGIMEDGFIIAWTWLKEPITRTDAFADSLVDGIQRGGNATMDMMFLEWTDNTVRMLTPWDALLSTGATSLKIDSIGELDFDNAGSLVLTAVAGTPAAAKPATFTAPKIIVAANHNVQTTFGPTLRKLPGRFNLLPSTSGSNTILFSAT